MKFEIYTKPNCPYCLDAKNAIKSAGYTFTEYTIGNGHTKEDIQNRIKSLGISDYTISTVPQIFCDNSLIRDGYSGLVRTFKWAQDYNNAKHLK